MIEYKLKPITETSWIMHDHGTRIAIVVASGNKFKAIGNLDKKEFDSIEDIGTFLKASISIEEVAVENELTAGDVLGYPIKHTTAHDIVNDAYPSYAKVVGSKSRFAAGYYGVLFQHGWVFSYCPKISTLEEHQWIGPYRTKLEMQNAISQQKHAPRV